MQIAGITNDTDEIGGNQWFVVGYSKKTGWIILRETGPFLTKEEARDEWYRLEAFETEYASAVGRL